MWYYGAQRDGVFLDFNLEINYLILCIVLNPKANCKDRNVALGKMGKTSLIPIGIAKAWSIDFLWQRVSEVSLQE